MGKWKPEKPSGAGARAASLRRLSGHVQDGIAVTTRETPGHRGLASRHIVALMEPFLHEPGFPKDKPALDRLAALAAQAWNVSRVEGRRPEAGDETRALIAEIEPALAVHFDRLLSHARQIDPTDVRLIFETDVILHAGNMTVNVVTTLPGQDR